MIVLEQVRLLYLGPLTPEISQHELESVTLRTFCLIRLRAPIRRKSAGPPVLVPALHALPASLPTPPGSHSALRHCPVPEVAHPIAWNVLVQCQSVGNLQLDLFEAESLCRTNSTFLPVSSGPPSSRGVS